MLGFSLCTQNFSTCGEWGLLSIVVMLQLGWLFLLQSMGSLGTQASVVAEYGLSSCGMWTWLPFGK